MSANGELPHTIAEFAGGTVVLSEGELRLEPNGTFVETTRFLTTNTMTGDTVVEDEVRQGVYTRSGDRITLTASGVSYGEGTVSGDTIRYTVTGTLQFDLVYTRLP